MRPENNTQTMLVSDVNEESVDIYDDLDSGFRSDAEKLPSDSFQLKDSMDLYEEIVTEEQQCRESSYSELKSRFQAAQNQIKELHRRLEQMEIKNTGLNTENCRLKKNISALLQTARQEVTRKDAEIQRLSQRSGRGYLSRMNNLQDQNFPGHASVGSFNNQPLPPPPPSHPPPPPSHPPPPPSQPPPPPSQPPPPTPPPPPAPPASASRTLHPPLSTLPLPREERASDNRAQPTQKDIHRSSHKPCDPGNETKNSKTISQSHFKSPPSEDSHLPDRQADKSGHKSGVSSSSRHAEPVKPKSKHREEKHQREKLSESADRRYRTDYDRDCGALRKDRSHKDTRRRYESLPGKSRDYQSSDGHHRSERTKAPPPETSHSLGSCDDSKARSRATRDIKSKMATMDYDHQHRKDKPSAHSSHSKDRKRSSSHEHAGHHRHKDDRSREHRGDAASEAPRNRETRLSNEPDNTDIVAQPKEQQEKMQKSSRKSTQEPVTEKNSVTESSPNRKLCFMETLNLTLSPVKKPALPGDGSQEKMVDGEEAMENPAEEEGELPNIEDMCVIDEADSSELEAADDQSTTLTNTQTCDVSQKTSGDAKEAAEVEKSPSRSGTDEQPEKQASLHPTPTPSQTSSPKATAGDLPNTPVDELTQDSQAQTDGQPPASDGLDQPSGGVCKQDANSPDGQAQPYFALKESAQMDSSVQVSEVRQQSIALASASADVAAEVGQGAQQTPPSQPQENPQQGLHLPASPSSTQVLNTISFDSFPQEGLSLPEAIDVLTRADQDLSGGGGDGGGTALPSPPTARGQAEEEIVVQRYCDMVTPKKNVGPCIAPSTPLASVHDEDSMMCTLSNLKRIPDAISPLRSPVQVTKRGSSKAHGAPGFVKSLQKEFSSAAVEVNPRKLDINKENKYPGSPVKLDTQNVTTDNLTELPANLSDTEVEEGEILSESDESSTISPVSANKRVKLLRSSRNIANPKSLFKRKSEEKCDTSKETVDAASARLSQSPANRSRFKTVSPASTKAPFSTMEEVMETFKSVRSQIRKKYMKLHKTFPKKSFYGMMENFQESFLEFVDGAHFGQICTHEGKLKSKMKKLIASVFSKVANNGIVKRIFEQQAVDLKQKLWDFVDVQVDSLFKDIHATLRSMCASPRLQPETTSEKEKVSPQTPTKKEVVGQCSPGSHKAVRSCAVVPYKTGLGSRGKDIRITCVERDKNVDTHACFSNPQSVIDFLSPKKATLAPDKNSTPSKILSQNGSLLEKTDFELLTEQQASSLTFNLVRDSQMGEIFKCLLQGSDLLESSSINGDSSSWSLSTPRRGGERLISITTPTKFDSPSKLLSPSKFDTPSKLIATWSSISPQKIPYPRSKEHIQLNPALFDESCLLEVPDSRAMQPSQKTYSILAEDLALSLTIPSPLKSDSHLSFIQSSGMHIMSTPESVISAHLCEDAMLDGEDVTEQDIHLALDTDNSSRGSVSSMSSEAAVAPFMFKSDLPMQALVMEKSTDHFILKIRQATPGSDSSLAADDTFSRTLTEDRPLSQGDAAILNTDAELQKERNHPSVSSSDNLICQGAQLPCQLTQYSCASQEEPRTEEPAHKQQQAPPQLINTAAHCSEDTQKALGTPPTSEEGVLNVLQVSHPAAQEQVRVAHTPNGGQSPRAESESMDAPTQHVNGSLEKDRVDCEKRRKRKKGQDKCRAKRSRKEEEQEEDFKRDDGESSCGSTSSSSSSSSSLSPNSLSAMNLIKKKGLVVMAWSRDEDRAILIDLKTKGASRETFSALSEKLQKPSEQIAQRFYQLMKLFKKKGKMDT